MTNLPNPKPRPGRGASDEFVHPNLERRTLWWLRCTGAMRADKTQRRDCDRPAEVVVGASAFPAMLTTRRKESSSPVGGGRA